MNLELPSDLNFYTNIQNIKRNFDLKDFHFCTKNIIVKVILMECWMREIS